jgi:hypothetical protein
MNAVLDEVRKLRFCVYIKTSLALLETAYAQVKVARSFGGLDEVVKFLNYCICVV